MEIINKVLNYITKHNLLNKGDSVICAVSGGADSVCMLDILKELKEELSLTLYVAHINHQLRDEEADRDELFVKKLAEDSKIPFYCKKVDVKALAITNKLSCEEAGRIARYDFLKELKETLNADKIATAHNRNDNVETVLMRIARGTDIKGLSGIPVHNEINVIRPIMCLKREKIEEYIGCKGLDFVTDTTNLSDDYSRNKIRHNLIPLVENQFNNSFIDTFSSNIELFGEANAFLEKNVIERYDTLVNIHHYGVSFNLNALLAEDIYVAKRIIKKAVYNLCRKHITGNVCNLIYDGLTEGNSTTINDFLELYVKYDTVYFVKKRSRIEFSYNLCGFGTYYIPELSLSVTVEEDSGSVSFNDKSILYLSVDKVNPDFCLRSKRNGDKMFLNNCGVKKLKDIMIDDKIPSFLRDEFPVLEYNGEIIWLCGVRNNGHFRAKTGEKYIKISLHKENIYE